MLNRHLSEKNAKKVLKCKVAITNQQHTEHHLQLHVHLFLHCDPLMSNVDTTSCKLPLFNLMVVFFAG